MSCSDNTYLRRKGDLHPDLIMPLNQSVLRYMTLLTNYSFKENKLDYSPRAIIKTVNDLKDQGTNLRKLHLPKLTSIYK